MSQQKSLAVRLEIIWWIATAIVAFGVLYPIVSKVQHYPFLLTNVVYIIAFITLTRYIFLLPHTFLAYRQFLKLTLAFLMLPLIFHLVQELNYFQTFLDEEGPGVIVGNLPFQHQDDMVRYIQSQMLLFGVGAIISAVVFPFRMIVSVWRLRNRGKV